MNRKPLVAIFGCGPAGLLAAWACQWKSVPFALFSKPEKSVLGGAQFSHISIPGLTSEEPEVMLTHIVNGDPETYQRKVYGDMSVPFVSMEGLEDGQKVPAWNLREMYAKLWAVFEQKIIDVTLDYDRASKMMNCDAFDVVFSSIPAPNLCDPEKGHTFKSQPVRIYNEALWPALPDDTILYDGTDDHSYYRMSRLWGVGSTEWGGQSPVPPLQGLRTVNKPISTNCTCHPKIQRIGRFGTWKKGILTYHSYNQVIDTFEKMGVDL